MEIKRPREILNEVTKLKMFETTNKIVKYLKEEYGLAATVEATRPDEFVDVYLTNFKHDDNIEVDLPEDKISKAILKTFNEIHKDEEIKAINVWPTEFGYTIVLDKKDESKELKENYLYYYYYNQANKNNTDLEEDENINYNMRKPLKEAREEEEALLNKLTNKENETEDVEREVNKDTNEELKQDVRDEPDTHRTTSRIDKEDIEQDISNTVLDNRFIWFFTIMDEFAEEITDEISNLDEAIDEIIRNKEAAMLVAYPYIDPNPEDEDVELVFADNPGPVILYDREEE